MPTFDNIAQHETQGTPMPAPCCYFPDDFEIGEGL